MARIETKLDLVKKYYRIGGPVFVIKKIKRSLYHRFRNIRIKKEYGEKRASYGSLNPDKTIYVIRRQSSGEGIGSTVKNVLSDMMYADSKGYDMVVDQLNYYNSRQSMLFPDRKTYLLLRPNNKNRYFRFSI